MSRPRVPAWLVYLLKSTVAVAVVVLMLRSGKLNPAVVASAAQRWPNLLLAAGFIGLIILITSERWRILLGGHGVWIGHRQAAALTLIGTLFSTVIPGAVSGDLVKAYYVRHHAPPGRRALAVSAILMDRVLGLAALATVAAGGVIWNRHLVFSNPTLAWLGAAVLVGCAIGLAGLVALVAGGEAVLRLVHRLPSHFPARGLLLHLAEVAAAHHNQGPRMFFAYLLSFPVHLLGIAMLLAGLHAMDQVRAVPPSLLLFAFPLGMLVIAIPITPAGVGVGQAAFYAICNLAVPGSGTAGANAFTIYQSVTIPVFLLGLIPYVSYRHEIPASPDPDETEG